MWGRLILQYMGEESGGQSVAARLETYPASMGVHKPPFCCLSPWQMGSEFVIKCKTGVFQYVVVRFFNTLLTTVLFTLGMYEEGQYSITKPFIWMTAVNFCSQSWALYSLFLFFLCAHKELHGMRPFSKFLCIKLIIFFSWWQALLIGILVRVGRINKGSGLSAQEVAVEFRVALISCEMLLAAIAFMYAFPISEFPSLALSKVSSRKKTRGSGSGRTKSFSARGKHALLDTTVEAQMTGELSPSSPQLLNDRLLVHAWKILECWNSAHSLNVPSSHSPKQSPSPLHQRDHPLPFKHYSRDTGAEESIVEDDESPCTRNTTVPENIVAMASAPIPAHAPAVPESLPMSRPVEISRARALQPDSHRAHVHRGSHPFSNKIGPLTGSEETTLTARASPAFLRRDPNSASSFHPLGSSSFERNVQNSQGQGMPRALKQDFDRHAFPMQPADDSCSASGSECSTDGTSYDRSLPAAGALNESLATLSYIPATPGLQGAFTKAQNHQYYSKSGQDGRARSTSKGHRSSTTGSTPASSWFEALWISTLPADLQEDISDLEAQIAEMYTTAVPVAQFKRLIKGNNATY